MKNYHVQCILQKNNRQETSWIPKKYAVVGQYIKLKKNNEWSDGWKVTSIGAIKESEQIQEQSDRQHKGIFGSLK